MTFCMQPFLRGCMMLRTDTRTPELRVSNNRLFFNFWNLFKHQYIDELKFNQFVLVCYNYPFNFLFNYYLTILTNH